jgi:hypothetical protein
MGSLSPDLTFKGAMYFDSPGLPLELAQLGVHEQTATCGPPALAGVCAKAGALTAHKPVKQNANWQYSRFVFVLLECRVDFIKVS